MTEYINTYNELCEKVKRWSAAYYEQDAPAVTDEEYDRAMHEIRDLEAAHPELVTSDSPTQVVGGKRVIGIPVEHRVPMLSLLDVFSDDDVRDFTASVAKEYPDATFSIERKIDGLSLSLVYAKPVGSDGKLRLAATVMSVKMLLTMSRFLASLSISRCRTVSGKSNCAASAI